MASFKFILDFLAEIIDGDRNSLLDVPENFGVEQSFMVRFPE